MAVSLAESFEDSDGQIAKLFEQAKEDFEHETHKKLNVLRRFDTVDDFIEQIRKEKAAFGSFREHEHPNLFRHIQNALKPIQILANLFSGPSGNVGDFMSSSICSIPSQSFGIGGWSTKLYFFLQDYASAGDSTYSVSITSANLSMER
jgi:hypothetical protein